MSASQDTDPWWKPRYFLLVSTATFSASMNTTTGMIKAKLSFGDDKFLLGRTVHEHSILPLFPLLYLHRVLKKHRVFGMNFGNCMVKAKTPVDCILSEFLGHGVGFYVAWSLQRFYEKINVKRCGFQRGNRAGMPFAWNSFDLFKPFSFQGVKWKHITCPVSVRILGFLVHACGRAKLWLSSHEWTWSPRRSLVFYRETIPFGYSFLIFRRLRLNTCWILIGFSAPRSFGLFLASRSASR